MKTVITDERINSECRESLAALGFNTVLLPPSEELPSPVASHTDMLIFRLGDTIIVSENYTKFHPDAEKRLSGIHGVWLLKTRETPRGEYPNDAILNALAIGDILLCKSDTVSETVKKLAKERGLRVLHTRQGYPACTVLALDAEHAITADGGIASLLSAEGVEVLRIRDSSAIKLPPYKYGFIGGTAGVYGDTVFFAGDISAHPDAEKIEAFIRKTGKRAVSLAPGSGSLIDVGGLIFIDGGTDND